MDKIKTITKETLIPLGLLFTIIGAIACGSYTFGSMNTKIADNEEQIDKLIDAIQGIPTRIEFEKMQRDIETINDNINKLLQK